MNSHYFNLKGQALIELATLGAILIFCLGILINYGLQANYQQEAFMDTFRRTMYLAYNQTSEQLGPNGGASVSAIDDRRMISPDNAYGLASRSGFESGASVTWANNLNNSTLYPTNSTPIDAYRPKQFYMMNGNTMANVSTDGASGTDRELSYTVANFVRYPCTQITIRENDLQGHPLTAPPEERVYWNETTVDCINTVVIKPKAPPPVNLVAGYYDSLGKLRQFDFADVDGDGTPESIQRVEGTVDEVIEFFTALETDYGQITNNQTQGLGLARSYTQVENQKGRQRKWEAVASSPPLIMTATRADERGDYIARTIIWQEKDPITHVATIKTDSFGTGKGYDQEFWEITPK